MAKLIPLLALSLALFAGDALAANIYKCKTKDGGVVISNTPCAPGAEPDAKLSGGSSAAPVYRTACERVEATGAGLVQIAAKLTPGQARAVEAEAFGRLNSAGASRILAEFARNGTLRVCAFFPGGDSFETLIEPSGLVRRDGVVDAEDPVLASPPAARDRASECADLIQVCRGRGAPMSDAFDACVGSLRVCGGDSDKNCCAAACLRAYRSQPLDHVAGLAKMRNTAECAGLR